MTAHVARGRRLPARLFAALALGALAMPALAAEADLIRRGEYLARAGDCVACHTAPGGKPMAGGLSLPTPLGAIVSTNITPSRRRGIGTYTLEQFGAALRRGVRADGARLYPAMPYPSYAKVSDDDVRALYAYFMHGVAAVDIAPTPTRLPFPFNIRALIQVWNAMYLDTRQFQPEPSRSAAWNRGAYLVRGLTHCSACHSPRGLLMAEDPARELAGGEVGPWEAPNITPDVTSGIGSWSIAEIVQYLKEGRAPGKGQAAGPMAEAVGFSLRYLTDQDLSSIATYLKSVRAVHDAADTKPANEWGAPADDLVSLRGVALPEQPDRMTGPQLYDAQCATCHQAQGQGSFDGGLPSLFHNTVLGRRGTDNLVLVMLQGLHREPAVDMPGFAAELSDRQLATLGNYLTRRWGRPDAQVSVEQVAALRAGKAGAGGMSLARVLVLAGAAAVALALFVSVARRRRPPARTGLGA